MIRPIAVRVDHSDKVDVRGHFPTSLPSGIHKTAKITEFFIMSDGTVKSIKELPIETVILCLVLAGKVGKRYEKDGYLVEY